MSVAMITHPLALYSSDGATERSYPFRIQTPIGRQLKDLRVWVRIDTRTSTPGTIKVDIKHSPDLGVAAFVTHTGDAIDNSSGTGLITAIANISTNGMLGSYIEIVLKVGGSGAFTGQVYIEGKPF